MQTGIIGLPQVGKTTLFRILTKAHVEGKGGASATHVGVAKVPEPRLVELAKLYNPKKITYATVNYVDLGGMQKERMRDALAQLREVDVIAHVIRVFDEPSVPHSEGSIDPLRDATNLDLELMLSDHDQITRRLERVDKDLKKKRDPILEIEKTALEKCKAHVEAELSEMDEKEAAELLASYGLKEPGLNRLIRATYDLLGLIQFFTAGEPEVRAWTIRKGDAAVKAAGVIHSDIERGFIRAEVVRWNDLLAAGSIAAAKEKAQVRLEGKEYVVQEGDVILFRHSG